MAKETFRTECEKLGDQMKELEQKNMIYFPRDHHIIVRLDGHGFSKFTKSMDKPCDNIFMNSMIKTAENLVTEFGAKTAYTASDEITLVFSAHESENSEHIYKGRKSKIVSLTAGFASVRFNYWLQVFDTEQKYKMKYNKGYFDSRAFSTENEEDVLKAVLWRYKYDTKRNGVSAISQTFFSSKKLHKRGIGEQIRMLSDLDVRLTDYPPHLLYGTFVKKVLVPMEAVDRKTGTNITAMRTRCESKSYNLLEFDSREQIKFLLTKYWNESILESKN